MFSLGLAGIVEGSQLGNQVGCVLGGIHCKRLRNDQQGASKLSNRQLFSRALKSSSNIFVRIKLVTIVFSTKSVLKQYRENNYDIGIL
jgi:hypothetical protein